MDCNSNPQFCFRTAFIRKFLFLLFACHGYKCKGDLELRFFFIEINLYNAESIKMITMMVSTLPPALSLPSDIHPLRYPSPQISIPSDIHPLRYPSPQISIPSDIHPLRYPSPQISIPSDIHPLRYPSPQISIPSDIHPL